MLTTNSQPDFERQFVAYFHVTGWHINLGVHFCMESPNVEIHLPFGFVRLGWVKVLCGGNVWLPAHRIKFRSFGLTEDYARCNNVFHVPYAE